MNKYLGEMVGRITHKENSLWLVKAHVIAWTMSLSLMGTLFCVVLVCLVVFRDSADQTWVLIARIAFLYTLELVIVGLAAIGVRAALVQELAIAHGRREKPTFWTGRKALWAGAIIMISSGLIQIAILANLSFFFG